LARLLIIDTALEEAIVAISNEGKIIAELSNKEAHSHASFIQVAIEKLLEAQNIVINDIDAIAVTLGPGSYTGLRVGLATAKGIAYAIQKPLIGLSTLSALAHKALKIGSTNMPNGFQVFPMIDARRMEIFGAIYIDQSLDIILPEQAIVLDQIQWNSLITKPTVCIGNGTAKTKGFISQFEVSYQDGSYTSLDLLEMASEKLKNGQFEDLAYVSPNYLKEVYILPAK
jgi:tRNA threonylcarbamoyladenosine biosynthesis protein TsaB